MAGATTMTATHLCVGVLGERLGDARLAAPKRAGDRARAAQHGREERVQHALAPARTTASGSVIMMIQRQQKQHGDDEP